jgi:opacity protein-like surface antigen
MMSSVAFAANSSSDNAYQQQVFKDKRHYKDYKDPAPVDYNHFEILGAGGIAKLDAGNSQLGVTGSEQDRLVQTNSNNWNTAAAQLGVGYVYYFGNARPYSKKVQWFPSIEPEINGYYLASNSINGYVSRFNSPAYNDLSFDIPLHSARLMLDAALTVVSWRRTSLYGIAGIGEAWNRISYSDSEKNTSPICTNQRVSLSSNTNTNFVWEVGAGLNYDVTRRVGVSLEYLYTHLGTVKTSGDANTGSIATPVISSPSFNLKSQTALLGLNIAL